LNKDCRAATQILKDLGVINVNNDTYAVLVRAGEANNQLQVYSRASEAASWNATKLSFDKSPHLVYLGIPGRILGAPEPSSPGNGQCPLLLSAYADGRQFPIVLYHLPSLRAFNTELIKSSLEELNTMAFAEAKTLEEAGDALLFGDFNAEKRFLTTFATDGRWTVADLQAKGAW